MRGDVIQMCTRGHRFSICLVLFLWVASLGCTRVERPEFEQLLSAYLNGSASAYTVANLLRQKEGTRSEALSWAEIQLIEQAFTMASLIEEGALSERDKRRVDEGLQRVCVYFRTYEPVAAGQQSRYSGLIAKDLERLRQIVERTPGLQTGTRRYLWKIGEHIGAPFPETPEARPDQERHQGR